MAFSQGLAGLGWRQGENVRVEYRWSASNSELIRQYAKELVALAPDVNSRQWHASSRGTEKNHQFDSDRLRAGTGSGSPRPREKPVAAGGATLPASLSSIRNGSESGLDFSGT